MQAKRPLKPILEARKKEDHPIFAGMVLDFFIPCAFNFFRHFDSFSKKTTPPRCGPKPKYGHSTRR